LPVIASGTIIDFKLICIQAQFTRLIHNPAFELLGCKFAQVFCCAKEGFFISSNWSCPPAASAAGQQESILVKIQWEMAENVANFVREVTAELNQHGFKLSAVWSLKIAVFQNRYRRIRLDRKDQSSSVTGGKRLPACIRFWQSRNNRAASRSAGGKINVRSGITGSWTTAASVASVVRSGWVQPALFLSPQRFWRGCRTCQQHQYMSKLHAIHNFRIITLNLSDKF
jgi:hypothetical protein